MIVLASLVETADGIVKTFGIDWPMLIAQAINFLIVALVIWKFAFKNILSTIKEREKQIADSLVNADKIKLELEETEKQQQETLQEASLAAKKTISSAQEQAKAFIESQKEDARKQAEEIISKAKVAMEQERERVLREAREEIAALVVLTTSMSDKIKSLARVLVENSSNNVGIMQKNLVEDVLSGLREAKPPRHREILREYLLQVGKAVHKQNIKIELGCGNNDEIVSSIKNKINQFSQTSFDCTFEQNENLIAGYRIRIVDDVYEDSIRSRLSKLSQSFTS
jgi:F-type H+-transporting ATPase subunit b